VRFFYRNWNVTQVSKFALYMFPFPITMGECAS